MQVRSRVDGTAAISEPHTKGHEPMSFSVPANQTVSWAVYWPSVIREAHVSVEDAEPYKTKIMRGFDCGEPVWMAALTLAQYVDLNRNYRPERTPLSLARKVVRT